MSVYYIIMWSKKLDSGRHEMENLIMMSLRKYCGNFFFLFIDVLLVIKLFMHSWNSVFTHSTAS